MTHSVDIHGTQNLTSSRLMMRLYHYKFIGNTASYLGLQLFSGDDGGPYLSDC